MEMSPMVPAQVPSYWMPHSSVADVDRSFHRAVAAGARELVGPGGFPGGGFAGVSDPRGATLRLLRTRPR